jgi:tetratricopeptide (TPR) repeat protein
VAVPDPVRRARRLPVEVVEELGLTVDRAMAPRVVARLADAAGAYERDRYQDAQRMLMPLIRIAPDAPALRELMGLCLYRQGRWGEAIRELEHYRRLTGSLDQHPVLADCHRALGHTAAVRELWDELREASPSPELVAEGRIVMAASLAERGEIRQAIELLDRSLRRNRVTREYHLRQWYALADLLERSGDVARARELFGRVAAQDPGLSDVVDRVAALR